MRDRPWIYKVNKGIPQRRIEVDDCVPWEVRRLEESFRDYIERVWNGDIQEYLENHKRIVKDAWRRRAKIEDEMQHH